MRFLFAALLLIVGSAEARNMSANSGKAMLFDPSFPRQLRADCTFYAPLTSSLRAEGRGVTTPTYTGGGMTGAGSLRGCVDCAGIIHWQASGPCYSCGGSGLAYESMGARTNLLLDNCGFKQSWTPFRLNASTNGAVIGPDNSTSTVYVMAEDGTATSTHVLIQGYTSTTAKNQTFSVYAKKGGREHLMLYIGGTDAGYEGVVTRSFNLATGAVGAGSVSGSASTWWEASSSISPAGNGWYRCVMTTGTATGTTKSARLYLESADGTNSYSGDNSSSLFIFGAQVEDNASTVGNPIKTVGATGARAADSLTYPTSNLGGGSAYIKSSGTVINFDASSSITLPVGGYYRDLMIFSRSITAFEKALLH